MEIIHALQLSSLHVASAWNALRRLLAANSWFWLVRSGSLESAPAIGLVLLHELPRLLDAIGAGASWHG
ncbi:MAG: hypothetical protein HQL44_09770 [Alphaproteobacteria bacterium]|nr:hypothetical protein [Alphaproteobacteria bacterium]